MNAFTEKDEMIGPFRGRVAGRFRSSDVMVALVRIPALLNTPEAEVLTTGRNRNVKLELVCKRQTLSVVVKAFRKPSWLKNALDRRRSSKARRTWLGAVRLAEAGVGTPEPVAFLERWVEDRLVESYFVAVYQDGISSFAEELNHLFHQEPECAKVMALMQTVAEAVHAMHAAGFQHNDLGNQNILLRRTGDATWDAVQFIDLNRGRIREPLTTRERARDISRLTLPSDFLRVFKEMYYDRRPPEMFQQWEARYRRRYAWHARTRSLRHPLREWSLRRQGAVQGYPSGKDLWIWDARSGQAQTTLRSKDRSRYYPLERHWETFYASLKALLPIWRAYRKCLGTAYRKPVEMRNRLGISIEVGADRFKRQQALLSALGTVPVMVRFYHHKSHTHCKATVDVVQRLHAAGHPVSIALVQDRMAVREPDAWQTFADDVLGQVGALVDYVEVGHAINRVKWGIWDYAEYQALVAGVTVLRARYPELTLIGPAVIDFEYPYVLAALDALPPGASFGALSHHLYMDRRGAPENFQGRFSALEKFALGKAIAWWSSRCRDRFIVSEVNWPLAGTGVYSPVGSPYVSPGPRYNDPSVSEDDYADYMIRYLLIALCSGFVERVYWWRLVAYGYGLVDDSDPEQWRERPAFGMLKTLLRWVGEAMFEKRIALNTAGAVAFAFRRSDESQFWIAYTAGAACEVEAPFPISAVWDAFGKPCSMGSRGALTLSGRPVYAG